MSMAPTATAPHSMPQSGAPSAPTTTKSTSNQPQDVTAPTNTHRVTAESISQLPPKKEETNVAIMTETQADTPKVNDEEFIKKVVNKAVQDVIQDETYVHEATNQWTNRIVETLVRSFVQMDRDNKYIVTCMIVQNLRQGMRSATSCFWNAQTDSGYSLTNERNGMYVITTVFICKS